MHKPFYPQSLADIPKWTKDNATTTLAANSRFMEFVILACIAEDSITGRSLVLKGGNALRFAYHSPRSTKDLDFTVTTGDIRDDDDLIRKVLDRALRYAERRFNVKAKCQRVKKNPRLPYATRPTYDIAIGYQFPEDRYFRNFEKKDVATSIPVEISFFDHVCETRPWQDLNSLRVCSLDDILAEKLRALLQQAIRNRNRYQDVYDIARILTTDKVDYDKIASYLKRKSADRNIDVRKSAFNDAIRDRAATEYELRIREQAPNDFIPFDDAWRKVLQLVSVLDIPD